MGGDHGVTQAVGRPRRRSESVPQSEDDAVAGVEVQGFDFDARPEDLGAIGHHAGQVSVFRIRQVRAQHRPTMPLPRMSGNRSVRAPHSEARARVVARAPPRPSAR